MCDYSLHEHASRLAVDGDRLVVHRFTGGTVGLAPAATPSHPDPTNQTAPNSSAQPATAWLSRAWSSLADMFRSSTGRGSLPAVCVPPGAQLILNDVPVCLQRKFNLRDTEHVVFTQLSMEPYVHRDAIRFENGEQLSLQELHPGQRVTVIATGSQFGTESPNIAEAVPEHVGRSRY